MRYGHVMVELVQYLCFLALRESDLTKDLFVEYKAFYMHTCTALYGIG